MREGYVRFVEIEQKKNVRKEIFPNSLLSISSSPVLGVVGRDERANLTPASISRLLKCATIFDLTTDMTSDWNI